MSRIPLTRGAFCRRLRPSISLRRRFTHGVSLPLRDNCDSAWRLVNAFDPDNSSALLLGRCDRLPNSRREARGFNSELELGAPFDVQVQPMNDRRLFRSKPRQDWLQRGGEDIGDDEGRYDAVVHLMAHLCPRGECDHRRETGGKRERGGEEPADRCRVATAPAGSEGGCLA